MSDELNGPKKGVIEVDVHVKEDHVKELPAKESVKEAVREVLKEVHGKECGAREAPAKQDHLKDVVQAMKDVIDVVKGLLKEVPPTQAAVTHGPMRAVSMPLSVWTILWIAVAV